MQPVVHTPDMTNTSRIDMFLAVSSAQQSLYGRCIPCLHQRTFYNRWLFLKLNGYISSYVSFHLPPNTTGSTSKYLTCLHQSISFFLFTWPSQYCPPVFITLLMSGISCLNSTLLIHFSQQHCTSTSYCCLNTFHFNGNNLRFIYAKHHISHT